MRITEKELEHLYDQALLDVEDVSKAEGQGGAAKFLKLREICRVTEHLGGLCLGGDAQPRLELMQGRAPRLYTALLELAQGGDVLVRAKFDKLKQEEEALRQERLRLEQAGLVLRAQQAEAAHVEAQLEREKQYLQLERERVAEVMALLPSSSGSMPERGPYSTPTPYVVGETRVTDPDAD